MENKQYLTIDGIPVEINGEKNLLELIRKIGIPRGPAWKFIQTPSACANTAR